MSQRHALSILPSITVVLLTHTLIVEGAPPVFVDVTETTGIEFVFPGEEVPDSGNGDYGGGGMAAADFDGDGDLDLILAGGYSFPMAFLRNDGDWKFSLHSGGNALIDYGWEKGISVGDYDNDGDPDLFVAVAEGPQQLLSNNGNGSFTNVTEAAGLSHTGDARVGVWLDYDMDGLLDLYVARYGSIPEGETNSLYHNEGNGVFLEVTETSGLKNWPMDEEGPGAQGNTWMALSFDFNNDGFPDLYDGNDWGYKHYKYGHKMWQSVQATLPFSLAPEASNTEVLCNCMGPAAGDVNGDGWLDLYFTNTYHGNLLLYNHCGSFQDGGTRKGLHIGILSWSAQLADFDLNGELDLFITTWHSGKNRMFLQHNGTWSDVSIATNANGKFWESTTSLTGDFDNDGDLDLVILNADSPMVFYENTGPSGYSLRVHLTGTTSNRDAVGAVARLHIRGKRQHRTRMSPDAFLSTTDPTLTFGMGNHAKAEAISVRWPNGNMELFDGPFIGGSHVELVEGEGSSPWPSGIPWMAEFGEDNTDNDCDGYVDEGFEDLGQPCIVGVGDCAQEGILVFDITQTHLLCDAVPLPPRTERCDGRDNDCDGEVDNGMMKDAPCWDGLGACRVEGLASCQGEEGLICDAIALAPNPMELCGNLIDDNCDGEVDETILNTEESCPLGTFPCDQHGNWTCGDDGEWFCLATGFPNQMEEQCGNGIDDDCDGEIDETEVPLSSPCSLDTCNAGGTWTCGPDGTLNCAAVPECIAENTPPAPSEVSNGCAQGNGNAHGPLQWLFLGLFLSALCSLGRKTRTPLFQQGTTREDA